MAVLALIKLTVISFLWITPRFPPSPILEPMVIRQAMAATNPAPAERPVPGPAPSPMDNATSAQAQGPQSTEQALDKRERDLRILEAEVNQKLETLRALEIKVQSLLDSAKALREEKCSTSSMSTRT